MQGWTVEATQRIPSGSFVAEYLGEYVTTPEARRRLRHYDLWNKQQQALQVPRGFRPQPGVQLIGAAPGQLVPGDPTGTGLDLKVDPGADPGADLRTDPGSESRSLVVPRGWGGHALMVSFSCACWDDSMGTMRVSEKWGSSYTRSSSIHFL